jgi:hypothetical protein
MHHNRYKITGENRKPLLTAGVQTPDPPAYSLVVTLNKAIPDKMLKVSTLFYAIY